MGLELFGILQQVEKDHSGLLPAVGVAAGALLLTIVVRAAFVAPLLALLARRRRRGERMRPRLQQLQEHLADPEATRRRLEQRVRGALPVGGAGDAAGVAAGDAVGAGSGDTEHASAREASGGPVGEVSGDAVVDVSGASARDVSGGPVGEVPGDAAIDVSGASAREVSGGQVGEVPGDPAVDAAEAWAAEAWAEGAGADGAQAARISIVPDPRRGPGVSGVAAAQDSRGRGRRGQGRQRRGRRVPTVENLARFGTRLRRVLADIDYFAGAPLGWREGSIVVWAGMRGAVTVAAAQTLPHDAPGRSALVLVAFLVAAGSLLLQGGTLGLVLRLVKPAGTDPEAERDERQRLMELLRTAAQAVPLPDVGERTPEAFGRFKAARLEQLRAQRSALLDARDDGTFSADVLAAALSNLDADEISIDLKGDPAPPA